MSRPFTTNEWKTSPPFRPNSGQRPSTAISAISRGSSAAQRSSVMDGEPANLDSLACAADSLADGQASERSQFAAGAAAGVPSYVSALVKSSPPTASAVVATYPSPQLRRMPFSGLYDDVEFPVHTLFAPPRPPGEQYPRTRRPNKRKPPTYVNDLSRAGAREHNAQREVSRVWRGVLCRRRLRQAHALANSLNENARTIQCWWRSLQARWLRRKLHALRGEWAKERTAQYVAERVLNTTSVIYWQHSKYEDAALLIQRVVRWHLRNKARRQCAEAGVVEAEWPPALPCPCVRRSRPYFPWRRRVKAKTTPAKPCALVAAADALVGEEEAEGGGRAVVSVAPHTLLQFRSAPPVVRPPSQAEVEAINAKMREVEAQRAAALQTPDAVSRRQWKTEGLRREDLDFNAGVVQRLYRSKRAPETMHTKELTAAYFNRAARIIARTFRMYVLIKHMRGRREETKAAIKAKIEQQSAKKIDELRSEAVWQRDLMAAAATTIQRCWAWHRYTQRGILSEGHRANNTVPTPPCYGLLTAHIEREHALRWSSMNLLEQRKYEEQRQHKYLRYVPAKVALYEHTGFLYVQPAVAAKSAGTSSRSIKGK